MIKVLVAGSRNASVAVGSVSSRVEVGEGKKDATSVSKELLSNGTAVGTAVGGLSVSLSTLVQMSHPIPRIETTPMTIGIKSVRSNAGRGCILGKVLL